MQLLFLYFRNQTNKWIQLQTHSFIGLYHRFSSCKINKHQGDNITQRLDLALIWRQFILTFERLKNKQDPPSRMYLPRENNSRQAWSHFIKRVNVQIMKCWKATNLSSSQCRKKKTTLFIEKKMTKQFYIFTNEKYSTCIYRYMYCKLKQQL